MQLQCNIIVQFLYEITNQVYDLLIEHNWLQECTQKVDSIYFQFLIKIRFQFPFTLILHLNLSTFNLYK